MHKYKTTTWERLRKRCNHGYRIESSHPLMVSFHLYKRWDWVNCVLCGRPCELQAETAEFWTETEFTKEVLYFDQFDLAFWLNFWLLLTQFPWRTPWSLALFPLRPPEFLSVWAEGLRWGRTQQALPTLSRSWSRLQTDISTFWANNNIYIHL